MTVSEQRPSTAEGSAWLRSGRLYVGLTLVSLVVAAASLMFMSTPSYDPWSWLIWGREILHGHLHIAGGSSWKPLPVIFTTVFAIFGSAAPNLWLIIARAGALLAVIMAGVLAARLTWELGVGRISASAEDGSVSALRNAGAWKRLVLIAPVVVAGLIALVGSTFTSGYPDNSMLGYSEGVMVAAALIAAERAYDGHHRQAFALGFVAALDRPEVWVFWGPYGLWLMWRDPGARRLVIGLIVLAIALWIVPQKLGGQSAGALISHAKTNHSARSAVNSADPFRTEIRKLRTLVLERVQYAAALLILCAVALLIRARRNAESWLATLRSHRALCAVALTGLFGFVWGLGIAVETQDGFAGNPRYAVLGVVFLYVAGGAAFGWGCYAVARVLREIVARVRRRSSTAVTAPLAVGTTLVAALFILVPNAFNRRFPSVHSIRHSLSYQTQLRNGDKLLIDHMGGPAKVLACGYVMTNNLQVTQLTWYLDVPIGTVWAASPPPNPKTHQLAPNVVFQDAVTPGNPLEPATQTIKFWESEGMHYTVTKSGLVTLYTDCGRAVKLSPRPGSSE